MTNVFYLTNKHAVKSQNDADCFFPELFCLIGLSANKINESEILQDDCKGAVLFAGERDYSNSIEKLSVFAEKGGTVVFFNTVGVDDLCGIKTIGRIKSESEFSVNGHFVANSEYMPEKYRNYPLPILSDILNKRSIDDMPEVKIIATLKEQGIPIVFERSYGKGKVIFFSFSLLKTIWYKAQGRPVYEDLDGDGYKRTGDSCIVDATDDFYLPVIDLYLRFIEGMIAPESNLPYIHQLPIQNGKPSDYVLYFSGDEDHCGEELITANNVMRERNLPYHVHMQPVDKKKFTISSAVYEDLKKKGMEFSLHFDFITDKTYGYDEKAMKEQVELYKREFRENPKTCNTHWFIYNGFGETARWYNELGLKGTMHSIGIKTNLFDINAMNDYGFAFGTSYPTRPLDDAAHGNELYDIPELKIVFYEPRLRNGEDAERIKRQAELAKEFGLINNIFIHPTYFTLDSIASVSAVDETLKYAKTQNVAYMSEDQITEWWIKRSKSSVLNEGNGKFAVKAECPLVLKFLTKVELRINDQIIECVEKTICGRIYYEYCIPEGKYSISVK